MNPDRDKTTKTHGEGKTEANYRENTTSAFPVIDIILHIVEKS